jgi:hypothetical protein
MVRALLEKGADPTITGSDGRTPMDIAELFDNPACIEALKVRCSLRRYPGSPLGSPMSPADRVD